MAKRWPALDIRHVGDRDLLLAALDDFSPSAIEESESGLRVFFATPAARDAAMAGMATRETDGLWRRPPRLRPVAVDVSDEDWARRSQENLEPIVVGRVTILPRPEIPPPAPDSLPDSVRLVIAPSMGFGTGPHATTRLCLTALQTLRLAGAFVLDVGTGT